MAGKHRTMPRRRQILERRPSQATDEYWIHAERRTGSDTKRAETRQETAARIMKNSSPAGKVDKISTVVSKWRHFQG